MRCCAILYNLFGVKYVSFQCMREKRQIFLNFGRCGKGICPWCPSPPVDSPVRAAGLPSKRGSFLLWENRWTAGKVIWQLIAFLTIHQGGQLCDGRNILQTGLFHKCLFQGLLFVSNHSQPRTKIDEWFCSCLYRVYFPPAAYTIHRCRFVQDRS